jgi:hypothetical protein
MVPVRRDEHLRLVSEAAERDRVDQPVAVALEYIAGPARPATILGVKPSARSLRAGSDERR